VFAGDDWHPAADGKIRNLKIVSKACIVGVRGKPCYWNGKYYKEHERIPYGDGCNSCLCDNGDVMYCTEMGCKNDSRKPLPNEDGEDYNADEYYNAYEEYQDYKPNPTPSETFNNCAARSSTGKCLGRRPTPKPATKKG